MTSTILWWALMMSCCSSNITSFDKLTVGEKNNLVWSTDCGPSIVMTMWILLTTSYGPYLISFYLGIQMPEVPSNQLLGSNHFTFLFYDSSFSLYRMDSLNKKRWLTGKRFSTIYASTGNIDDLNTQSRWSIWTISQLKRHGLRGQNGQGSWQVESKGEDWLPENVVPHRKESRNWYPADMI